MLQLQRERKKERSRGIVVKLIPFIATATTTTTCVLLPLGTVGGLLPKREEDKDPFNSKFPYPLPLFSPHCTVQVEVETMRTVEV